MRDQRVIAKLGTGCTLVVLLLLGGCASTTPAPVVERGGQPATAPAASLSGKDIYTVKKGDTLRSIALDHGVDSKELAAWNSIDNPNLILIGQSLRVKTLGTVSDVDAASSKPIIVAQSVEKRSLDSNSDTLKREPKAGKEPYSDQAFAKAQVQQKPIEAAAVVSTKPEITPETKPAEPVPGGDDLVWVWPANGKMIGSYVEGSGKGIDISGKSGDAVLAATGGKVILVSNALRSYGNMVVINHSSALLTVYAHNSKVLVKEGQVVTKGQKIAEMGNTGADQVKLHFEVRRQGKPVDPLKHLPQR